QGYQIPIRIVVVGEKHRVGDRDRRDRRRNERVGIGDRQSGLEDGVDPVIGRLEGLVWKAVGGAVGIDAVAAACATAGCRQRRGGPRIIEIADIGGIEAGIGVIGSDVG